MEVINTKMAPTAIGPYSQAVKQNGVLYISGQLGLKIDTGELADSFTQQCELIFSHLKHILQTAGMSLQNAVKVSVFIKDMQNFPLLNEIYAKNFSAPYPAREVIEVSNLPKNGQVEISLIATDIN